MRTLHPNLPTRRSMAGVSLVELMIAVVLGLMVLATLASVFANTSATRNELDRTSRQIENGRFAMEILANDLRLAGFYGELAVNSVTTPPPPGTTLPDPCSTTVGVWKTAMLVHVQGYDNGAGAPGCMPGTLKPNTDILVVRRASSCEAGVAGCPAPSGALPYVQVSKCSTETALVATTWSMAYGSGDPSFNLHLRDCATVAGLRQYFVYIYYISTDNGQGQPIPTLKRLEFNGTGFTDTPLVEGIEELNIEYGLDNNADGAPDIYTADPSNYTYAGCTACDALSNWQRVVTARITLLARNTEPSPNYTDPKTYTIGLDAAGNPITRTPGDNYRRHVYTSLVRIVNASERKDVP